MKITLKPGKYVVAVSGGVDSIVLLDLLAHMTELQLVVAHFDHGIRLNSRADREFVQQLARNYGLNFKYTEGNLGEKTSESTARKARYDYLKTVMEQEQSEAIVTAHHQDDVLETAIINIMRGTNRKGLSSLRSTTILKRPLLEFSKAQLTNYAKTHGLQWREDSTNRDDKYLRNYVRHQIIPKLNPSARQQFLDMITTSSKLNDELDSLMVEVFKAKMSYNELDRSWFNTLPHAVARDLMASWLRQSGCLDLNRRQLEHLTIALKTLTPGKGLDVDSKHFIRVNKDNLALTIRDR